MATELKLKEDIKKLKAAISSKATQEKFKAKLKNQLGILEAELSALQKPAPIKLSRAKQLKAKYKALYGVRFQGIDIEKDADIPAMRIGKRTSQGIKGNQYASKKQAKGHTYYEYRENRIDMKQPPKKYPKLEDGGYMAKGGELKSHKVAMYSDKGGVTYIPLEGEERLYTKQQVKKHIKDVYGKVVSSVSFEDTKEWDDDMYKMVMKGKMEDGGMMADGGETETEEEQMVTRGFYEDEPYEYAKGGLTKSDNELMHYEPYFEKEVTVARINEDEKTIRPSHGYFYPNKISKKVINWANKNGYTFIQDGKKYADGGYMAKGGNVKNYLYIPKSDIKEIKALVDGVDKSFTTKDIIDGAYVKNSSSVSKVSNKSKFPDKEIQSISEKMMDIYNDAWDKIDISSGSDLYSNKNKQELIGKFLSTKGLDKIYTELSPKDRDRVSDILQDENYHSLNNYLALRGYRNNGEWNDAYDYYYEQSVNQKNKSVLDAKVISRIEYSDGGMMAEGGEVNGDNMEMVVSQIKAIKHHAEELSKIVTPSTPIEAWVVAKIERSETDLSDVTHYLDGLKMKLGGKISSSTHRLNR